MSPADLDALLARLDRRVQTERPNAARDAQDAAAAIRALRARLDDWENDPRTKAMEVEIQGAMADVTRLNRVLDETPHGIAIRENAKLRREAKERSDEYQGLNAFWKQAMDNQVARAERAEAEVERLRADNERGAWIDEARANLVRAERAEAALARARGLLP